MTTIWKYELPWICGEHYIQMPILSSIITAQKQNEILTLWAIVNSESKREDKLFYVVYTGEKLPIELKGVWNAATNCYIATIQHDNLVYHIFQC